jgi:hypothetical protein
MPFFSRGDVNDRVAKVGIYRTIHHRHRPRAAFGF